MAEWIQKHCTNAVEQKIEKEYNKKRATESIGKKSQQWAMSAQVSAKPVRTETEVGRHPKSQKAVQNTGRQDAQHTPGRTERRKEVVETNAITYKIKM